MSPEQSALDLIAQALRNIPNQVHLSGKPPRSRSTERMWWIAVFPVHGAASHETPNESPACEEVHT